MTGDRMLLAPLQFGAPDLPDRILMAPLTRSRSTPDGRQTPLHAAYRAQRAARA